MWFFGHVCKTIYFCKKATHQGIHKNFDVLHQHFWQEDTKLWQLVPLMNKLGPNFEKNYEIDPECGVLPVAMIVRLSIFMTKLPSEADAKNRLTYQYNRAFQMQNSCSL